MCFAYTNAIIATGVELFFVQDALTVPEGVGEVTLTLVKNGTNSRDIMVNYGTLDGDAIGEV